MLLVRHVPKQNFVSFMCLNFNMDLIVLSLLFVAITSPVHGSLCDSCSSGVIDKGKLKEYCHDHNLAIRDRCCVNSTTGNFTDSDIIGIDLRYCGLQNQNITGLFTNLTSVVLIMLEENPLNVVTEHDFYNLTQLDYLSLPGTIENCPGGPQTWKISQRTPDNATLLCQSQIDTCENEYNNGTCPSPQSYCSTAGPGLVDCLCSPDYHGYKCLRKGTFPLIPFVGGICGSTLVTAIFLWVTQRRFVKKQAP